MPVFQYEGYDLNGRKKTGSVTAADSSLASQQLQNQGLIVSSIREGKATEEGTGWSREINFGDAFRRVRPAEIAIMSRQMSTLIGAKLPVVESLAALTDQTDNPKLKNVLADVQKQVEAGNSLADSMSLHPRVFSDLFVSMVRAGEASGALEVVLSRLAEYAEKSVQLRNKVMAAMAYPFIMIFLMIGVIAALMTFVVPKITQMFEQMRQTLPIYTKIFIAISNFMAGYWYIILAFIIIAVFAFSRWRKTEKGAYQWDTFVLRVPIFGRIVRLTATSRFTRTLSTLLSSGIPILKAMSIVEEVVSNKVMEEAVAQARESINKGSSIAAPLKESGAFPPIVTHMISVGEKSGELEEMLANIAQSYDNEVESMITALTSILEPVLIVIMAAVIFFMIIAILLPIFQMNQLVT